MTAYTIKPLVWTQATEPWRHDEVVWYADVPFMMFTVYVNGDGTATIVGDGGASEHESLDAARAEVERMYHETMLRHLEPVVLGCWIGGGFNGGRP